MMNLNLFKFDDISQLLKIFLYKKSIQFLAMLSRHDENIARVCKIVILKRKLTRFSRNGNEVRIQFHNNVSIRKDHKLATKQLKSHWFQLKSNSMYSTNLISPRTFNFGTKYFI